MTKRWKGCLQEQLEKAVREWERDMMEGYKVMKVVDRCSALSCFLSGPSIAIILPEIALTYIMVVTFLVSTTVTCQPTNLTQLKSKAGDLFHQGWQGGKEGGENGPLGVILPQISFFLFF